MASAHHDDHAHDEHHVHVTPLVPMVIVFVLLIFLTFATVWTANIHYVQIGNTTVKIGATAHMVLAMAIASVKGILVAGFFMHLFYDKAVNGLVAAASVFAVALFIGLTMMDLSTRGMVIDGEQGEVVDGGSFQVVEQAIDRKKAGKASNAGEAHEGEHGEDHDHAEDQGEGAADAAGENAADTGENTSEDGGNEGDAANAAGV